MGFTLVLLSSFVGQTILISTFFITVSKFISSTSFSTQKPRHISFQLISQICKATCAGSINSDHCYSRVPKVHETQSLSIDVSFSLQTFTDPPRRENTALIIYFITNFQKEIKTQSIRFSSIMCWGYCTYQSLDNRESNHIS